MKIPRPPHNWRIGYRQAVVVQKKLALQVRETSLEVEPRFAAGIDAAYSKDGSKCIAGVVLWDLKTMDDIEHHTAVTEVGFPYIPGLLTFREGQAMLAALRNLKNRPDILLFDGQGIAHPRGIGIASHIGVITGMPSVGCAKSRLVGSFVMPGEKKRSKSPLLYRKERVGTVLRTRDHVKPVFVSIGHLIDLDAAEKLVLDCAIKYRLPEPIRLAHQLVALEKAEGS